MFKEMSAHYLEKFRAARHEPRQCDEDIGEGDDIMAMAYEFHNGPVCTKCGYGPCMWCVKEITPCTVLAV